MRLTLPARPGPLTLVYPRWLPGMHAPQGPLENVARLALWADGRPLTWSRDPYDPYRIRVEVPRGARTVEATYDYVPPARSGGEVFYGVAATRSLAVLNPSAFALAPVGDPRTLQTTLHLRLPRGWTAASALTQVRSPVAGGAGEEENTVTFAPTPLYTVIDSPILAGAHRRTITLPTPPGDVPHTLDLFTESPEGLAQESYISPLFARMVRESAAMFGTRHYRAFHFMLALTDQVPRNGLEHHESVLYVLSPQDFSPRGFAGSAWSANLIPHEFVHSWNGKFRRPYGEAVESNVAPQSSDLIWVYEGLTEYLGEVLMVRSGFRSAEDWRRDMTERIAAPRDGSGRDWQSLADAALAAPHTYVYGPGTSLRPVEDVYYDSAQVWLEVDAIIRRGSLGARSLDDFCRDFFGGPNRGAEVVSYTRRDVTRALNRVLPYDWDGFLETRFYRVTPGMPLQGVRAAGWDLVLGDAPEYAAATAQADYRFSLGTYVFSDGRIGPVREGSPADRAGLREGGFIMGVAGFRFSPARLRAAVRETKNGGAPLELLIVEGERYRSVRVEGLSGERYPSLVPMPGGRDVLTRITTPRSPGASAPRLPEWVPWWWRL